MMVSGLARAADALAIATPDSTVLYPIARYFHGIIAFHRGKPEEGAAHIAAAGAMAENIGGDFNRDPYLKAIVSDGRYFRDWKELAALSARPLRDVLSQSGTIEVEARFLSAPKCGAPFLIYAGMNETYLDRFGASALAAVRTALSSVPDAVFHLHVIDPGPEIERKVAALQEMAPEIALGLSTEHYGAGIRGYARASYYACARFVRLPEVISKYGRPIFFMDIDVARLTAVERIMESTCGFGCFEVRWQRPSLVCHASIITLGADLATYRFAELVAKFLAQHIGPLPFWLLDQTALLMVSRYCKIVDPEFRITDLTAATKLNFDDCFESAGDAAEKQGMRHVA